MVFSPSPLVRGVTLSMSLLAPFSVPWYTALPSTANTDATISGCTDWEQLRWKAARENSAGVADSEHRTHQIKIC